jgi:hypothetical protein
MPHLKKVSVNRWTDQQFMGDALRGTGIVFSRKPDPNLLGVDVTLNEEAWAAQIKETLDATRGVPTEFIIRDVYTVHGNLNKPRRAVEIARREIGRAGIHGADRRVRRGRLLGGERPMQRFYDGQASLRGGASTR